MIIRPTVADDWPALKALRLAALADAPTAFGVTLADARAWTDDQWRRRAAGGAPADYWLAWRAHAGAEKPVGLAGGTVDDAGRFHLIAMWVAPAARGTGAAGRLVDAVLARARARGHERVVLDVAPDNLPACALYRRHGFVFVDAWEPLASHPHILVQRMAWHAPHAAPTTC